MMKKITLILFLGMLMALQQVSAQCIPTSVRPITGTISASTGTFNYNNIPTGNVIQINAPAANTYYNFSLCSTNPANSPDGLNDSYLTILDANSAAANDLAFADDGCTTNVPNGWGPTVMNFTAPSAGTFFVYLTEYNAAGTAFCVADGVNNAYDMVVTVTAAPPVCEAGTLTSPLTQVVCPGQTGTIATTGNSTPGDYAIGFVPGPTGTGGNTVGFNLTGVTTLPYTFDDDLNGVLSGQPTPLPPLDGEWILTLYAVDGTGNFCDSTATTSVTFADASNPACGGTGFDAAITNASISEYSAVPLSQVTSLTPSCEVTNNGTSTMTGISVACTITDGASATVYSSTLTHPSLTAGSSIDLTAGTSFTPSSTDLYIAEFIVSITQNDGVAANDTFVTAIAVEDSLYARDFFYLTGNTAFLDGPWFLGAANNGQLGNVFRAEANADLVSATAVFGGAFAIGDQSQANLYAMTGGVPGALIASSAVLTVSAADTPVVFYDFAFPGGTSLTAGTDYFISIQQNAASSANFGLYSSVELFTPNTSFLQINGGQWFSIDTSGIGNQTFMVRANVYVPPVVNCAITNVSAGNQTACNPSNNTYTQEVTVTYSNPPGSGMLNVNGQMFAITSSPQTVTLTGLTADAQPVNVTAVFTADAACTYTESNVFTAPANCTPVCAITDLAAGGQTPCVNTTNLYTQQVVVTYSTPPATGMLNVNGQMFAITGSPQTVTLTGLNSDGLAVDVTALFTANAACTYAENAVFTAPASCLCPTITVNVSTTNNTNCSTPNGTATAVASGGSAPYTYAWTPSGSGSSISGLPSGTYTATATDANGCTGSGTASVGNTAGVNAVVGNVIDASCNTSADGTITINATGGTAPITYTWSDQGFPSSLFSRSNLTAGSYTVVVQDAGGCFVNLGPIVVDAPDAITVSLASQTNASCNGASDGAIDMNVTGGTMPYTYSWSNSTSTSQDLANLAAGTYQLTVTDANSCPSVDGPQVTITQPALIAISLVSSSDVSCTGPGSIDVSVTGGTPPYTYNWGGSNPSSEDLPMVEAGSYQLTVTDANNCTGTSVVYDIEDAPTISLSVASTEESSAGADDGTATVTVTGGTAPFNYVWDDPSGQTTATASGLSAGTYNVVVTDAQGCTSNASVVVDLGSGIRELALTDLRIYPNPTQKEVTISFASSTTEDFEVVIYSPMGDAIIADEALASSTYFRNFDVSMLAAGIYFVEISSAEGKALRKLTIYK